MKISVFVGTSIDAFIARPNGDLDFLPEDGPRADYRPINESRDLFSDHDDREGARNRGGPTARCHREEVVRLACRTRSCARRSITTSSGPAPLRNSSGSSL